MPRVLYVQYTNPAGYPPVEHGARLLADAGWDVLLLGIAISDAALALGHHDRMRVKLRPPAGVGWRQKLHYAKFLAWAVAEAGRWRPDWIYASDALSCPIALVMAKACGARLVYHEHDSPDTETNQTVFMKAVLQARRRVAMRAALCVLPNARRMEVFREGHPGSRSVTVWNCPSRQEAVHHQRPAPAASLRVLYHGSIVPGRLPTTVIEALGLLPSTVTLSVVGYETVGFPGYVESLRRSADAFGVASRVQFVGPLSRRELMRHCAGCDAGLSLLPMAPTDLNEREMVGASNKPFDYMACGLALVVSDLPAWRTAFVDGGYALACNPGSVESVAVALRHLLEEPALRRRMGDRGRQRILDDWNYERAFTPVLAVLNAGVEEIAGQVDGAHPATVQHVNTVVSK